MRGALSDVRFPHGRLATQMNNFGRLLLGGFPILNRTCGLSPAQSHSLDGKDDWGVKADWQLSGRFVYMPTMRGCLLMFLFLAACGSSKPSEEPGQYVLPANGDPANFTWSGSPRHQYAACGKYIELHRPFEVVPGGWDDLLGIPLSYIDNPNTHDRTPEGVDQSQRVSYAFPAHYKVIGLQEWLARWSDQRSIKSPSTVVAVLKSKDARHESQAGGDTAYQGLVHDRQVAMICTATNLPNPYCEIEVEASTNGQRFLARFPPKAADKLDKIIDIGVDLFGGVAGSCGRKF